MDGLIDSGFGGEYVSARKKKRDTITNYHTVLYTRIVHKTHQKDDDPGISAWSPRMGHANPHELGLFGKGRPDTGRIRGGGGRTRF